MQTYHLMVSNRRRPWTLETAEALQVRYRLFWGLRETGKIIWLGQPLLHVTMKLAKFMTEAETGVIQKHASKLKRKISRRHQELSSEVNTIIDYADMLYDDEEGTKLFTALKDFDDYPNTTQPSDAVCSALMESFLKPYRRLSNTELRQQLVDSINMELRAKMPEAERPQDISLGFLGINEVIASVTTDCLAGYRGSGSKSKSRNGVVFSQYEIDTRSRFIQGGRSHWMIFCHVPTPAFQDGAPAHTYGGRRSSRDPLRPVCLSRRLGREEVRSLTRPASFLVSMTASQKEEIASQSPSLSYP
uniref:SFRICE_016619 n=1 Tax=Spodoptera frugiperda TaxID=7108 RepID=A0A2H1VAM7_SPOFR